MSNNNNFYYLNLEELREKIAFCKYVKSKLVFKINDLADDVLSYQKNGVIHDMDPMKIDEEFPYDNQDLIGANRIEVDDVKELFEKNKDLHFALYEKHFYPTSNENIVDKFPVISLEILRDSGLKATYAKELGSSETYEESLMANPSVNFFGVVHYFQSGDDLVRVYVAANCYDPFKSYKAFEQGFDHLKDTFDINTQFSFVTVVNKKKNKFTHYYQNTSEVIPCVYIERSNGHEHESKLQIVKSRDNDKSGYDFMQKLFITDGFIENKTREIIFGNESLKNMFNRTKEIFERYKADYDKAKESGDSEFLNSRMII